MRGERVRHIERRYAPRKGKRTRLREKWPDWYLVALPLLVVSNIDLRVIAVSIIHSGVVRPAILQGIERQYKIKALGVRQGVRVGLRIEVHQGYTDMIHGTH